MRWSLDKLYTSLASNEFKQDLVKLDELADRMKAAVEALPKGQEGVAERLENYITQLTEYYTVLSKLSQYVHLTMSVDTANQEAIGLSETIEKKGTKLASVEVAFANWLGAVSNIEEVINSSDLLKEHSFFIKMTLKRNRHRLSEAEETLLAKLKTTGSSAWSKLREALTADLMVDVVVAGEEKCLPISVVRGMAYDQDGMVRKSAYEAELKAYPKIEEPVAACLNGIKGEVITVAEMRRFSSPLAQTLFISRMDEKILEAMLAAMKESLPQFYRYYQKKAELLGHTNNLPFYDIFAPVGELNKKFTYEEARELIVDSFTSFSEKLGSLAKTAFDKQWIDAEPRKGKRGGAFCSNIHAIGESRILANFNGNFSDIITLAHELGHAYHGLCLTGESYLNSRYPMPLAETASTFCETIVKEAAIKKLSQKESFTVLENELAGAGQIIVDIYSRFLFEDELFNRRSTSALSAAELKEMMLRAQRKAYGPSLDENQLHPYMWINKPHYYSADQNYYNFPYAFGLLFAKGLYAKYLQQGDAFIAEYDKLLAATGKQSIAEVAALADIDATDIAFWRSSLKLIEADLDTFITYD